MEEKKKKVYDTREATTVHKTIALCIAEWLCIDADEEKAFTSVDTVPYFDDSLKIKAALEQLTGKQCVKIKRISDIRTELREMSITTFYANSAKCDNYQASRKVKGKKGSI